MYDLHGLTTMVEYVLFHGNAAMAVHVKRDYSKHAVKESGIGHHMLVQSPRRVRSK